MMLERVAKARSCCGPGIRRSSDVEHDDGRPRAKSIITFSLV